MVGTEKSKPWTNLTIEKNEKIKPLAEAAMCLSMAEHWRSSDGQYDNSMMFNAIENLVIYLNNLLIKEDE